MKRYQKLLSLALLGVVFMNVANAQEKTYSWDHLPTSELPVFKKDTFNIVNYGARPDGITLNTKAINKAISEASAKGGGVVLIPQGVWLSGPIILQNNVNLHAANAALIQFTDDKSQYALIEGNFEGRKSIRNQSPISGTNLSNIAITGSGIFDARGEIWRPVKKDKLTEGEWKTLLASGGIVNPDGKTWYPSAGYLKGEREPAATQYAEGKSLKDYESVKDFFRPNMLVLTNCRKILIQDATFQNSAAWGIHPILCEQLTIDGIQLRNLPSAQNGDGLDMESCAYVTVKNSVFDVGDDGICVKSGKDEEGRARGKASKYIVIKNNTVYRAHGGFVIGSEMSGGAHDIFVSDCTFIGTDIGLRFKTARGRGGIVENIYIRNIGMHNVVHDAILFDMYYFAKAQSLAETNGKVVIPAVDAGTPRFRKFYIRNIVCEGAGRAMLIRGLPEMSIEDIHLEDVSIRSRKGADIMEARNVSLKNVTFKCDESSPLINIENSSNITFNQLKAVNPMDVFFSINGDRSKAISIEKSDMSAAKTNAVFNYGATKSQFEISR